MFREPGCLELCWIITLLKINTVLHFLLERIASEKKRNQGILWEFKDINTI